MKTTKMICKKTLGILMALTLIALTVLPAAAETGVGGSTLAPTPATVTVGNMALAGQSVTLTEANVTEIFGKGATFDQATNTLTLKGLMAGSSELIRLPGSIHSTGSLNLVLEGDPRDTFSLDTVSGYGIHAAGDLTIEGSVVLNITLSGTGATIAYGLASTNGNVTIKDTNVKIATAEAGAEESIFFGIYAGQDLSAAYDGLKLETREDIVIQSVDHYRTCFGIYSEGETSLIGSRVSMELSFAGTGIGIGARGELKMKDYYPADDGNNPRSYATLALTVNSGEHSLGVFPKVTSCWRCVTTDL